jgi:hypothetical protein
MNTPPLRGDNGGATASAIEVIGPMAQKSLLIADIHYLTPNSRIFPTPTLLPVFSLILMQELATITATEHRRDKMRTTSHRHSWRRIAFSATIFTAALLASAIEARAVFIYASDTVVTQNLSRPSDSEGGAGWDLQADFSNTDFYGGKEPYLATPIDATHFITAKHIYNYSSSINPPPTQITFRGIPYDVATPALGTTYFADPNSDLAIYTLAAGQTFPTYATLYDEKIDGPLHSDTVNKAMTVIGCGTTPGSSVVADGLPRGWRWYGSDVGNKSWGQNQIVGYTAYNSNSAAEKALFVFAFTSNAGQNSILTAYDSSGGIFVQGADGTWKLAGINYSATGEYRLSADGASFKAALFDQRGLFYEDTPGHWVKDTGDYPDPGYSVASSISNELDWIRGVVPGVRVPEPGTLALLICGALSLVVPARFARRRKHTTP